MLAEVQIIVFFLSFFQHFDEFAGGENIIAHRGETGFPFWYAFGLRRFFFEGTHAEIFINREYAEA